MAQVISTNQAMREAEIDAVNYINGDLQDIITSQNKKIEDNSITNLETSQRVDLLYISKIMMGSIHGSLSLERGTTQSVHGEKPIYIGVSPTESSSLLLIYRIYGESAEMEMAYRLINPTFARVQLFNYEHDDYYTHAISYDFDVTSPEDCTLNWSISYAIIIPSNTN